MSRQAWIENQHGHTPGTTFLVTDDGIVLREHAWTLRSYGLTNNTVLQLLIDC